MRQVERRELWHKAHFGFGAGASQTLLCAAVYLGMFENRRMNASKLADYVGVPRSTMDLEELEQVNRVERRGTTEIEPVIPTMSR